MEENVVKMWQWNQASSDVDTGGIKAEFKDTVENEDKEFETVTMGYKRLKYKWLKLWLLKGWTRGYNWYWAWAWSQWNGVSDWS